ncbi:BZ3500_MvSof-1268-A1-R1_Chr4-2g07159 [Microbotryum saponariae]|uniref:BZ3500_MvSof-1268-A1-R1_Chr4-2g07159 protein n=1 Tax=Microbotryum saponariae TaxID=289078 RepID=A0A2X0LIC0_9BASI|nr:BZ3500_MvSof-1268-A1-R1_Chr4-2g07159 [Microbotryum saponariae]SDA06824.1 BZ3501_MvSof-1269-A2-R1_Chr4-2g06870 [Microbotryum saponariae]
MKTPKLISPLLAVGLFYWLVVRRREAAGLVDPIQLVDPDPHTDKLCDPFAEPGFLKLGRDGLGWAELDRDTTRLSFLKDRAILVLGDSVDRNALHHFAEMFGLPRYCVPYDDFSKKGVVPMGWDDRGIPWVIEVPWLGLTLTNGFFYGVDDEDNFKQQPDWHAPGKAEDRIDKLLKVHTAQLPQEPSFISLHSGLWDLAFFGRQDRAWQQSSEAPLSNERVRFWVKRAAQILEHTCKTWPGTPVWYRKLHRVGPVGQASYDFRQDGKAEAAPEKFSNFFTNVRTHQLREMMDAVAIATGAPVFDFGGLFEGWQSHQTGIHPNKYPAGPLYISTLIHHVYMEHVGRENWRLSHQRDLFPVTGFNKSAPVSARGVCPRNICSEELTS